jgi:hypothetical protein
MKNLNLTNILIIIIVLGIVTLGVIKFSGLVGDNKETIDVSETATIMKPADRVLINVGVEITKDSASEAEEENTKITNQIYESLKSLGLSESEYSTEYYNVYPNRNWNTNTIDGYTVSHNIKIDTEKIDLAGDILDKAIESGANQIYGLQFSLKEETEKSAREEAYKKASENARLKAEAIAKGLGVKITKIVKITDSSVDYYPLLRDVAYAEDSTIKVEVNPGEVTVTASISVSYGFK